MTEPAPVTIGVVGTAKNTGKTTTVMAIVRTLVSPGTPFTVTSIGYDGEPADHLTCLPKPRYFLPRGAMVVTSEACIGAGSAPLRRFLPLGVRTALGQLWLAQVDEAGSVVVAGPNSARGLARVKEEAFRMGTRVVLVDGSFGRLAPMTETSVLVLCTGAARTTDLQRLAEEVRDVETVLGLPSLALPRHDGCPPTASFWRLDDSSPRLLARSPGVRNLIVESQLRLLLRQAERCAEWDLLFLPGAVNPHLLKRLASTVANASKNASILLHDPTKLLCCADAADAARVIRKLTSQGKRLLVMSPMRLACVTVNPFYPKRSRDGAGRFDAHYVDPGKLRERVARYASVPVVDVKREPERFYRLVEKIVGM